jgi:hypothetical protein
VRLTINGEPINYSLENERTLGEVVRGVQGWLAEAGFHVTGMIADAHDLLSEAPDQWSRREVSSVAELGVQAAHTGDMKLAHWRTVEKWLEMVEVEIRAAAARSGGPAATGTPEPGSTALSELLSDFPETLDGMRANPYLPPGATAGTRFEALFTGQAAADVASWPASRLQEAVEVIAELRGLLARRLADASAPAGALTRCAAQIRESMTRLPEVSVLLQTGRDKAAMEIVISFADVVQSILGLVPFLPPDAKRAKQLAELTPFLRDLVSAFDARDSILIGDLLEYEITPRIERLAPVLEGTS